MTKKQARVFHADLWGTRDKKYTWLSQHDWAKTEWQEIEPIPDLDLFVPTPKSAGDYQCWPKITEIFPVYSVGIVTARDHLTIRWTPDEVWNVVLNFSRMDPELAREAYNLGKDVRDWKVAWAQKDLRQSGPNRKYIVPILYRPFDVRYTYYTGRSRGFICMPRPEVMRHMLAGDNLALVTPRRVEHAGDWQHAFVSNQVSEHVVVSLKTIDYHFPLYIYANIDRNDLFSKCKTTEREPNLGTELVKELGWAFGEVPAPEDIFCYVYAVLYAPSYRGKYVSFLRRDFPRIPFSSDHVLFQRMAELGKRLVDLHLLRSSELDPPIAPFQGEGDNKVETGKKGLRYDAKSERVYINESQYFEGVPPEVWFYQIGGYQVCEKWLKDRKGRKLTLSEIRTYCHIVTALAKTIQIQRTIDELYPKIEETLLAIQEA